MLPTNNHHESTRPVDVEHHVRHSGMNYSQIGERVIHDMQQCQLTFPGLKPILEDVPASDAFIQHLLASPHSTPIVYVSYNLIIPRFHMVLCNEESGKIRCRHLALSGTIPMVDRATMYRTLVHIRIMPCYPADPPVIFVLPNRRLRLRNHHPYVDSQTGLVHMPYLSCWNAHTSTIAGAVNAMINIFFHNPPLYSLLDESVSQLEDVDRTLLITDQSDELNCKSPRSTSSEYTASPTETVVQAKR